MANYHSHITVISRGKGGSPAQKVSYICGVKIYDSYRGIICSHSRTDVVFAEVLLPEDIPEQFSDLQTLVTEIDRAERRRDSQTARMIDFSLPIELSTEERVNLARRSVREFWVGRGMCALIAVHDAGKGNPHAHVLLTTREVSPKGFGAKNRSWNQWEVYRTWRKFWADAQNLAFKEKGLQIKVSEESYFAQGIDKKPTRYLGPKAVALEKKGVLTERAEENLAIMEERQQKEQKRENKKIRKKHRFRGRTY